VVELVYQFVGMKWFSSVSPFCFVINFLISPFPIFELKKMLQALVNTVMNLQVP
jgi:hypothetical protein